MGRPESATIRIQAVGGLGRALTETDPETALRAHEVATKALRRFWPGEKDAVLVLQGSSANCYDQQGRNVEALRLYREVYAGRLRLNGSHAKTVAAANNLVSSLSKNKLHDEAKRLGRENLQVARQVLGEFDSLRIMAGCALARAIYLDCAYYSDILEALRLSEDAAKMARRALGPHHPTTIYAADSLEAVRRAKSIVARF